MKKECVVCGKRVALGKHCDRHYKYYLELDLAKEKEERDVRNKEYSVQEALLMKLKPEKISETRWL